MPRKQSQSEGACYLEFVCQDNTAHVVSPQAELMLPLLHFRLKLLEQFLKQKRADGERSTAVPAEAHRFAEGGGPQRASWKMWSTVGLGPVIPDEGHRTACVFTPGVGLSVFFCDPVGFCSAQIEQLANPK